MVYSSSSITAFVEQGDSTGRLLNSARLWLSASYLRWLPFFGKHDFLRGAGALVFGGICVALLVLTALLGTGWSCAKRWLIIGPVSIQISEFAKIAFVLLAARIAEDYRNGAIDMQEVFRQAAIFIIIPLGFFVYHAIRPRYYNLFVAWAFLWFWYYRACRAGQ